MEFFGYGSSMVCVMVVSYNEVNCFVLFDNELTGRVYYKLSTFFSVIFQNMYISSYMTCLYVHKLQIRFDLI